MIIGRATGYLTTATVILNDLTLLMSSLSSEAITPMYYRFAISSLLPRIVHHVRADPCLRGATLARVRGGFLGAEAKCLLVFESRGFDSRFICLSDDSSVVLVQRLATNAFYLMPSPWDSTLPLDPQITLPTVPNSCKSTAPRKHWSFSFFFFFFSKHHRHSLLHLVDHVHLVLMFFSKIISQFLLLYFFFFPFFCIHLLLAINVTRRVYMYV